MNESTMNPCSELWTHVADLRQGAASQPGDARADREGEEVHSAASARPRPAARCRSCVTARTRSPSRVRVRRSQTARRTPAREKRRMTIRFQGRTRSGSRVTPPDIQLGLETSTFWAPKVTRTACTMRRLAPQVASRVSSGAAVELPHHGDLQQRTHRGRGEEGRGQRGQQVPVEVSRAPERRLDQPVA
jgi:hypothetical protein